ncbi:MAG: hypothetical protein LBP59_15680 [Planctomycetaceae bacterium]|jgi:transposase|nr:hypothetical protein [Planctomycetaceae bacterium]
MTLNTLSNLSVVGIDVSKETLDVYHLPSKEYLKVQNNKDGFKELLPWLKKREPDYTLHSNP